MADIDVYLENPEQAYIDAVIDPFFAPFIEPGDLEVLYVDAGDGTQQAVQALKKGSVRKVLQRMIDALKRAGVNLKNWICSKDEFDLCSYLRNTFGGSIITAISDMNKFLNSKLAELGAVAWNTYATFAGLVTSAMIAKFIAILSVLGMASEFLTDLCDCEGAAS